MKRIYLIICIVLMGQLTFGQKTLSLQESKTLAFGNNAKSKNSKLEMQSARQVKKSAFTNYFPSINASGIMFGAQKYLSETHSAGGNLPVYDGNPANLATATQFAYFPSSVIGIETGERYTPCRNGFLSIYRHSVRLNDGTAGFTGCQRNTAELFC